MTTAAPHHTKLINNAETLVQATFVTILPCDGLGVDRIVRLRQEFRTLLRIESQRHATLMDDLAQWRGRVTTGEIDFDQSWEDEFKGALRALVGLEELLLEHYDAYRLQGVYIATERFVMRSVELRRAAAQTALDNWESPEWETADERSVKWDGEQTAYLRERLASHE